MDNLVADYATNPTGLQTFWAVFFAAALFVVVNIVSHAVQERINEARRHRLLVRSSIEPVLGAASDLISRLCEILVYQRKSMVNSLTAIDRPDIMTAPANQLDRVQSTAYRLLRFLVCSHYFQTATASTPHFSQLRRAYYFLQRKIPTAMKGGFYQIKLLAKEEQEFMAAEVCDCDSLASVEKLNIGRFSRLIKSGEVDPVIFGELIAVLTVDPSPIETRGNVDPNDLNWRRLIAWAHIGVYLIDFFQDLRESPRWEEYRIVLVSMIRQWNVSATKTMYLYHKGDLHTGRYLDTYSERLCWRRFPYWFERLVPGGKGLESQRSRYRRWVKSRVLTHRGRRYEATHRRKQPTNEGLQLQGTNKDHFISYTDSLADVHEAVLHFLYVEGEVFET